MDGPAEVTQEEGHIALIFITRRIQPSLSLIDREVDFFLCTHKLTVLDYLLGIILFYFILFL